MSSYVFLSCSLPKALPAYNRMYAYSFVGGEVGHVTMDGILHNLDDLVVDLRKLSTVFVQIQSLLVLLFAEPVFVQDEVLLGLVDLCYLKSIVVNQLIALSFVLFGEFVHHVANSLNEGYGHRQHLMLDLLRYFLRVLG